MSNEEVEKIVESIEQKIKDDVANGKEEREEYNKIMRSCARALLKISNNNCSLVDVATIVLLAGATFHVGRGALVKNGVINPVQSSEMDSAFNKLLALFASVQAIEENPNGQRH